MLSNFRPAPEVEAVARPLIAEHHKHLIGFDVRIEYIFAHKTPTKNGQEIWGKAQKIGSLANYFATKDEDKPGEEFFAIVISEIPWLVLTPEQRIALVDHELMHLWVDVDDNGDHKLVLIGHDFEGFNEEVRRHGLWRKSAEKLFAAMKEADEKAQGTLNFSDAVDTVDRLSKDESVSFGFPPEVEVEIKPALTRKVPKGAKPTTSRTVSFRADH